MARRSYRNHRQRAPKRKRDPSFFLPPPSIEDSQKSLFSDVATGPSIIPRPKHCISRKNIEPEALKVLYRLKDHGYLAYLVGGSVRDLLLGKKPKDFDIGTDATPEEVRKLFRYSRIIGKRFRLVHVYFRGGKIIEVSTFRRQIELDDREAFREGLGPDSIFGSPKEDAFRRDLTINGLFYNIADFSIIDYVGGIKDLQAGVIRTIGDPERRFIRDPVRMLRAIRHAARTGFKIDDVTWQAILRHGDKIRLCAIPRVRDEWLKDIGSGFASAWMKLMLESGMFHHVFPGLSLYLSHEDKAEETKKLLISMLKQVDRLVRTDGKTLGDSFFVAAMVYPLLHLSPQWKALEPVKVRWPTHEVRALIDSIFFPYDFKRADREHLAQLLSSQWPIIFCAAKGRWQKRVYNKAMFPESLLLYNCLQRAQGQPVLEMSDISSKGRSKAKGNGKRGRRRGRPRHLRSRSGGKQT